MNVSSVVLILSFSFHQMINSMAKTFVLSSNQIRPQDTTGLWEHVFLLWLNKISIFFTLLTYGSQPSCRKSKMPLIFFSGMFSPWIISGWKIVFWHKHMLSFKLLLSCIAPKNICFVGYSVQQKQESIFFFLLQILCNIRLVRPWAKSSGFAWYQHSYIF